MTSKKALRPWQMNNYKLQFRKSLTSNPGNNGVEHWNNASEKMSGFPEISDMVQMEKMDRREKLKWTCKPHRFKLDKVKILPEIVDIIDNSDSPHLSPLPDPSTHSIERIYIVMRKQEMLQDSEVNKSSPLIHCKASPGNHPILALAIRNSQIVKLVAQNGFEGGSSKALICFTHHNSPYSSVTRKDSYDLWKINLHSW